jgi:hypothetical protein
MTRALESLLRSITPAEVVAGAALSIALMGACVGTAVLVVTLWPPDHFVRRRPLFAERHPLVRALAHFGKNALGLLLVVVGVVLSLPGVPGPGFAVIFIGLTLLDFPGKRRVELWVLGRRAVHHAIDRVRARFGREPLVLPGDDADAAAHDAAELHHRDSNRRAS